MSTTTALHSPIDRKRKPWLRFALACVVALLGFLYFTGRMDHALYPMGLNFHACARNGLGATFCGSELTQYEQRWQGVEQQIKSLAAPPIQPLPGATPGERQAYQQAKASYCADVPNATLCQ